MQKTYVFNDTPIDSVEADILHRKVFVDELAQIVEHCTVSAGMVIGVEGAWGSGKTSFLHLLERKLSQEHKVVWLDAWSSISKSMLVEEFFERMIEVMGGNEGIKNKIINCANYLLGHIDALGGEISVGNGGGIGNCGMYIGDNVLSGKVSLKLKKREISVYESFKEQKKKLIEELEKANDMRICIIDDIDRLSDQNIMLLFQMVKAIAGFPNVIYILAYDKNIVIRALDKVQDGKGHDYLQKIVQYPFALPDPLDDDILNYFYENLCKIVRKDDVQSIYNKPNYFLINGGVHQFLTTIRACNLLLNTFSERYFAVMKECNVADLLAISALSLFAPDVIEWLRKNHNDFYRIKYMPESEQGEIREHAGELKKAISGRWEYAIAHVLGSLFPTWAQIVGFPRPVDDRQEEFRIDSPDYFCRYFQLQVKASEITMNEVEMVISYEDSSQIYDQLLSWQHNNKYTQFLTRLNSVLEKRQKINIKNIKALLTAMSLMKIIQEDKKIYGKRSEEEIRRFIRLVLESDWMLGSVSEKNLKIKELLGDENIDFGFVCVLFDEVSTGQPWKNKGRKYQNEAVITGNEYVEMSQIFKRRLNKELSGDSIWGNERVHQIIEVWHGIDEEACAEYFGNIQDGDEIIEKIPAILCWGFSISSDDGVQKYWRIDLGLEKLIDEERWCGAAKYHIEKEHDADKLVDQAAGAFVLCIDKIEKHRTNQGVSENEVRHYFAGLQDNDTTAFN